MYQRSTSKILAKRLAEPRGFMQVVVGPRQTGKTTAIRQALGQVDLPLRYAEADALTTRGPEWIETQWRAARALADADRPAILVIDEVQKVPGWSEVVKRLWDEDAWSGVNLLVVLSGSSSLLVHKDLADSLAGRYEVIRSTHWTYGEMASAFDYTYEDYLCFGGYPGAARLRDDRDRWATYLRDSIIEATISRDVLEMEDVRQPALMRRLFLLGAQYSARELSYRKILGQLDDKGNTATIAHYLDLLDRAGLMCGLQKYSPKTIDARRSSPRLMVRDPSLMVATMDNGPDSVLDDPAVRGHLVESAVGATLLARGESEGFDTLWWRDGNDEVDFVLRKGERLKAIEVKSGRIKDTHGLYEFCRRFPEAEPIVVGDVNMPVESFLRDEAALF